MKLLKNPIFVISLSFFTLLLLSSTVHFFILDNDIPQTQIIYALDGVTPIDKAPFSPSSKFWFGTDHNGNDFFYQIISGAKYTFLIMFLVSILRLVFSLMGGILLSFVHKKISLFLNSLINATYFLPVPLLCYFILYPILSSEALSFFEKGVFQIIMLVIVAVPMGSTLFWSELELIKKNDFILGAKIMGAGSYRIFTKHMVPHLIPKLILYYFQQCILVLLLMAHLGLIKMFFGGVILKEDVVSGVNKYVSLSNEWSGLIGSNYYQIVIAPWLIIIPVLFFSLSIIFMNLILASIKDYQATREVSKKEKIMIKRKTTLNKMSAFQPLKKSI